MTTEITIAAAHLSATRTARALAALGAMLASGQPDAYSEWCTIHPAIELAR